MWRVILIGVACASALATSGKSARRIALSSGSAPESREVGWKGRIGSSTSAFTKAVPAEPPYRVEVASGSSVDKQCRGGLISRYIIRHNAFWLFGGL